MTISIFESPLSAPTWGGLFYLADLFAFLALWYNLGEGRWLEQMKYYKKLIVPYPASLKYTALGWELKDSNHATLHLRHGDKQYVECTIVWDSDKPPTYPEEGTDKSFTNARTK